MMKHQIVKTPHCKFCEGSGETVKNYTSHWQFSKPVDGILTCPKLLRYKCKICYCTGHVETHCKKSINKKEFCRFCFNAKQIDFQSHNQFSVDGFIQCPILLEIECQICFIKGHTKNYCSFDKTALTHTHPKTQVDILEIIKEEYDEPEKVFTSTANSWAGRVKCVN